MFDFIVNALAEIVEFSADLWVYKRSEGKAGDFVELWINKQWPSLA